MSWQTAVGLLRNRALHTALVVQGLGSAATLLLGLLIACKNRVDEVLAEQAKAQQVDAPVQSRRVRVTGVIE